MFEVENMLEVCFNDSVKVSLILAQNCPEIIGMSIGFIPDKKRLFPSFEKRKALKKYRKIQSELHKQAIPLGGCRKNIAGIFFGLSEGDIKTSIVFESCPRKDYICSPNLFEQYNKTNENMEESVNGFWKCCIEDLEKLRAMHEKIRVWVDNTPYAQCGLLFVADLLKSSNTEIHIVELPEREKRDEHCKIEYRNWSEVDPALFGTFLERERILTRQEIENLSNRWQTLKAENASLRVVENGMVISADESYYDDLIRKEFPEETCSVANIIGNALVKQKILTGDAFIANRIYTFIERGELEVIENSSKRFYSAIVKAVK